MPKNMNRALRRHFYSKRKRRETKRVKRFLSYCGEVDENSKDFKKRVGLLTRTPACSDHSAWNSWRYLRPYYSEAFSVDYLLWCEESVVESECHLPIKNPKNIYLRRKPKEIFDERRLNSKPYYCCEDKTAD